MITAAREELAALLADIRSPGWSQPTIHPYPPESITPPAVIILPDSSYLDRQMLTGSPAELGLVLQLITTENPRSMDGLIWDVVTMLGSAGIRTVNVPAPAVDPATRNLVTRIPVTLKLKGTT